MAKANGANGPIPGGTDRDAEREAARERFLEACGHRPSDHRVTRNANGDLVAAALDVDWRDFPEGPDRERALRRIAIAGTERGSCGWWWCATPDKVGGARQWNDLLEAVSLLKARGRDYDTNASSSIVVGHHSAELWRDQADSTDRLYRLIEGFEAPEGSDAAHLRNEFLKRLEPLRDRSLLAQGRAGRRGPRIDRTIEQALEVGAAMGWTSQEVAAMLLIGGVERASWDSLREAVRKADERRKSREAQAP